MPAKPCDAGSVPQSLPWAIPAGTFTHVPKLPGTLHARHAELQSDEQQTPSMHLPDAHSVPALHARPVATSGTHEVPEHRKPARQSELTLQLGLQVVAFAQTRSPEHATGEALGQSPLAAHVRAAVNVLEFAQVAAAHVNPVARR